MGRHVKMHQSSANRLHTCPYCTFSTGKPRHFLNLKLLHFFCFIPDVLNALNYHKRLHEDSGGYDSESTEESQLKPTAPTVAACETSIKPTSDCQEFSCQHCPFKTFHGSTFESHVRCHDTSVERAYSCQLCSFRTGTNNYY